MPILMCSLVYCRKLEYTDTGLSIPAYEVWSKLWSRGTTRWNNCSGPTAKQATAATNQQSPATTWHKTVTWPNHNTSSGNHADRIHPPNAFGLYVCTWLWLRLIDYFSSSSSGLSANFNKSKALAMLRLLKSKFANCTITYTSRPHIGREL